MMKKEIEIDIVILICIIIFICGIFSGILLKQYFIEENKTSEYVTPSNPVIVNTPIGDCYTSFTIEGIQAACRFCSGINNCSIVFPKGVLIIDEKNQGTTLFTINSNYCRIEGRGMDNTHFIVLSNNSLFSINGTHNKFSDINITFISENNIKNIFKNILIINGEYTFIDSIWISIFDYKYYIHKLLTCR